MNKNKLRFYIVLAVVMLVFCVIALAVPFVKNAAFWLSFVFGALAIGVQFYAVPKALEGDARSKFYGFPILKVSLIYLAAQLVLSLVYMALAMWLPAWLVAVLSVLLLCAAVIGFAGTETVRDEIVRQDETVKKDVSLMRSLRSKAGAMAALCESEAAKKAVNAFAEELRFSDPMSSDAIAEAEAELSACIDKLHQAILDGSEADILTMCRKAGAALSERNRLCKLNK